MKEARIIRDGSVPADFLRGCLVERTKRCCCVYFIEEDREAYGVEGRGSGVRRHSRAGHVGVGL
ncbi:MAG: hypothetical protein ACOYLK_16545, partial [Sphingomonas sp.]